MAVIKFGRPGLDDELTIAIERLDEAEARVRYYAGELSDARKIHAAVKKVSAETLQMLNEEVEELDGELQIAQAQVGHWKEILADPQSRASHPRGRKEET